MADLFAPDHVIEVLRGARKLRPSDARRALGRRAAWLVRIIGQKAKLGEPCELYEDELKAIVQASELFPMGPQTHVAVPRG